MEAFFAPPLGALLIFCLRIVDVSMAVMRMLLAVRGHREIAAFIGFFEVLLWLFAAGAALEHLDSPLHIIGFAGGFAAGNYVGVWLESRFALGLNVVRAVLPVSDTGGPAQVAAGTLRDEGFAVTELRGRGRASEVEILNVVVQRKEVPHVMRVLKAADPDVFITVEEIRSTYGGTWRPGGRKLPFLTR